MREENRAEGRTTKVVAQIGVHRNISRHTPSMRCTMKEGKQQEKEGNITNEEANEESL